MRVLIFLVLMIPNPCQGAADRALCEGLSIGEDDYQIINRDPNASPYSPDKGIFVPERSTAREKVFYLASGNKNLVQIFRVIPDTGSPYIVRAYPGELGYERVEEKYRVESLALNFFWDQFRFTEGVFRIPEPLDKMLPISREGEFEFAHKDVRGRPLDQVLVDERIPKELREKISATFDQQLRMFLQLFEDHYTAPANDEEIPAGSIIQHMPGVSYELLTVFKNELIRLNINPFQFIVEFSPTNPEMFEIYIIDGY